MVQHISRWIGEEPLVGDEYDGPSADPYKVQLRAVKRACVVSLMEQMVNVYANDSICTCSSEKADCGCFTITNNRVPNRMSQVHLMAIRLYYGSTSSGISDKKRAMRMLQTRILWENTSDPVIVRNAALLKLKTATWGAEADEALNKLSSLLDLDVVPVESEEPTDLFDDSDDEAELAENLDDIQVNSQKSRTQQPYNVNQGSIESELHKFLNLPGDHFVKCKS